MEVRNSQFSAFIDVFTPNTYVMVIMSDPTIRKLATPTCSPRLLVIIFTLQHQLLHLLMLKMLENTLKKLRKWKEVT